MRIINLICTLAIITIVAAACNKKNQKPVVAFENTAAANITVSIYFSQADYFEEASPIATIILKPREKKEVDGKLFREGQTYYYDWHTDDYSVSNWGISEYLLTDFGLQSLKFTYPASVAIQCSGGSENRLTYLGAGNQSVIWKATDAHYPDGNPAWNNLHPHQKQVSVTINKDYTAAFSFSDSAGNITVKQLRFDGNSSPLSLYGTHGEDYYLSVNPMINYGTHQPGKLYLSSSKISFEYTMELQ